MAVHSTITSKFWRVTSASSKTMQNWRNKIKNLILNWVGKNKCNSQRHQMRQTWRIFKVTSNVTFLTEHHLGRGDSGGKCYSPSSPSPPFPHYNVQLCSELRKLCAIIAIHVLECMQCWVLKMGPQNKEQFFLLPPIFCLAIWLKTFVGFFHGTFDKYFVSYQVEQVHNDQFRSPMTNTNQSSDVTTLFLRQKPLKSASNWMSDIYVGCCSYTWLK